MCEAVRPHRAIARLVCGAQYVRLDETQCLLQHSRLAFDASTFEIWGALLNGGRCVVAPPGLIDAAGLRQLVAAHGITTLWLSASHFNAVVGDARVLAGVTQILIAIRPLGATI